MTLKAGDRLQFCKFTSDIYEPMEQLLGKRWTVGFQRVELRLDMFEFKLNGRPCELL
jgi:hypothetical protein